MEASNLAQSKECVQNALHRLCAVVGCCMQEWLHSPVHWPKCLLHTCTPVDLFTPIITVIIKHGAR